MPSNQTANKHKQEFASRLNELCDDMKLPVHGRQTALARTFHVGPKAARKWLIGEGYPELDLAISIAKWANASFNWLMTGQGAKREGHADTKVIVLGEALESMPEDDRQQAFDFIEYKIRRSETLFAGERLARYLTMIDAFKKDRDGKK
jgi:transcriptional regulator with XRE-family HTH domain